MIAPTLVSFLLCTYSRIGPATMGAAGKQVRKVCRLLAFRMPPAPAFTRNSGTLLCSAIRAVASPTSLEMIPPTATTPSRSISRSSAWVPSSALDWSSATTSSSWRPSTPPRWLISFTASCIPSRTCTPHGVKLPVSEVSAPMRIGSPPPSSPPPSSPPQAASRRPTTSKSENCPTLERCLIVSSGPAGFPATLRAGLSVGESRGAYQRTDRSVESTITPDLPGGLDDQTEFGHLFLVAEHVALNGRGEATLGRQTQLLDGHEAASLLDAALELVLVLELAAFGGDQTEHDQLPLGDEPQRLEPARALVVVLQEEAVDLEAAEQRLGDEVVAALGGPGRAEVAPAHVGGDRHAVGLAGQRLVDLADVALMQVLGVVAAAGDLGPLLGVV